MDVPVVAAAKIVADMLLLCLEAEHNRKGHVWTREWIRIVFWFVGNLVERNCFRTSQKLH
jgi:hypothetical protein